MLLDLTSCRYGVNQDNELAKAFICRSKLLLYQQNHTKILTGQLFACRQTILIQRSWCGEGGAKWWVPYCCARWCECHIVAKPVICDSHPCLTTDHPRQSRVTQTAILGITRCFQISFICNQSPNGALRQTSCVPTFRSSGSFFLRGRPSRNTCF